MSESGGDKPRSSGGAASRRSVPSAGATTPAAGQQGQEEEWNILTAEEMEQERQLDHEMSEKQKLIQHNIQQHHEWKLVYILCVERKLLLISVNTTGINSNHFSTCGVVILDYCYLYLYTSTSLF